MRLETRRKNGSRHLREEFFNTRIQINRQILAERGEFAYILQAATWLASQVLAPRVKSAGTSLLSERRIPIKAKNRLSKPIF